MATAQDQVPVFELGAVMPDTTFDIIPERYHQIPVIVHVQCKVWSPTMAVSSGHFRNIVQVEGAPDNRQILVEPDIPTASLEFEPADCVEGEPLQYTVNIKVHVGEGFPGFVPLHFRLDIKADKADGSTYEE